MFAHNEVTMDLKAGEVIGGQHDVAGDPRCQDEMLKQLPLVAEQTEYTTLKAELLPRMHALCLKTTSASVRVNALTCMARVAARLDEDEAGKMLQTAGKVGLHPFIVSPLAHATVHSLLGKAIGHMVCMTLSKHLVAARGALLLYQSENCTACTACTLLYLHSLHTSMLVQLAHLYIFPMCIASLWLQLSRKVL